MQKLTSLFLILLVIIWIGFVIYFVGNKKASEESINNGVENIYRLSPASPSAQSTSSSIFIVSPTISVKY